MKILHIINDDITGSAEQIIKSHAESDEVKVIELSKKDLSYEDIIDDIFSFDKVISW